MIENRSMETDFRTFQEPVVSFLQNTFLSILQNAIPRMRYAWRCKTNCQWHYNSRFYEETIEGITNSCIQAYDINIFSYYFMYCIL